MEMKTIDEVLEENRVIRFFARTVYGNVLFYPVDFKLEIFQLTGQQTLSWRHFRALEVIGFKFVEVFDPERKVPNGGDRNV